MKRTRVSRLTPDILRELLEYNPETGVLTWKHRSPKWFTQEYIQRGWNTQNAGNPALQKRRDGYKSGAVLGIYVDAHRVAWAIHHGAWPAGDIDHLNGDRGDNRIANLRAVERSTNCRNIAVASRNKSGVVGVCYHTREKRWAAFISGDNGQVQLGRFRDFDDAVAARKKAEMGLGYTARHGSIIK